MYTQGTKQGHTILPIDERVKKRTEPGIVAAFLEYALIYVSARAHRQARRIAAASSSSPCDPAASDPPQLRSPETSTHSPQLPALSSSSPSLSAPLPLPAIPAAYFKALSMEKLSNGSVNITEKNQDNDGSTDAGEPEEPADIFIYREDVISLKSKEDARGLVMEVAGEYDSEGSITGDDTDTEEHEHKSSRRTENGGADGDNGSNGVDADSQGSLPDNKVRVLWIDGAEKTEDIDSVIVIDRSFLHGDIVASASDPTGQMGLVADVNLVVDLQGPHGEMIKGVSSKDLRRIREFNVGDYVVSGPWLGRVDEVWDNVNVLFDDGSVCKVAKADPMRLRPASGPMHPDAACPFYPGQRVKAVSSSVYKTSRWLNGLWKASRLEGTITKVETVAVIVYWIASAHFGTNHESVPPEEQNPKDLTLLSCFSYANWQLTDWCLPYQYTSSCTDDSLIECSEIKDPDDISGPPYDIPEASDANPGRIDYDFSADGSNMLDGDNTCLAKESESGTTASTAIPKEASQDNASYRKKLRKVFVKKDKRTKRRDESFERALLIANTHTKVDVIWQDGTKEFGASSTSLIPIHSPNDHEFFPEQYVVDKVGNDVDDPSETKRVGLVKSVNAKDRTASVSWFKPSLHPEEPRQIECNEIVSAYELDGHPDYDYCYGDSVIRLPSVSLPLESTNRENTMELDKNVHSTDASATGVSDVEEQPPQKESSLEFTNLSWAGNIVGFQNGDIKVIWGDGTMSKVGPHEIYVVGREDDDASLDDGTASDGASWETVDDNETDLLDDSVQDDSQNVAENNIERENGSFNSQDGSSVATGSLSAAFSFVTRIASELFARESGDDIDKDEGENHVVTSECTNVTTNDSSAGKSVDVDMVDGPADSDCFKHFDVLQCPQDHHYLENMVQQGTGGRKWVKKVQQEWSILEKNLPDYIYVRVFEDRMDLIRAVIIGASGTPYQDGLFFFDFHLPPEYPQVPPSAYYHSGAGYEKQVGTVEGEKNALPYNENTYLLSLKSMLYILRRPPMHFEDFVKNHFSKRGSYILKACEAYLQDVVPNVFISSELGIERPCTVDVFVKLAGFYGQDIMPNLNQT
ncbi:hypothetical protein GUJ93_ZPchr0008g14150 [Zizania palustris]|uniref:UBC core domain-containing protein n=1 Tax=Zizania palustris TaxID=103762 RepID=A0A8J5V1D4_ZIZPA|nr:hypothetical protein GUJ93_ZPchr0008g14150 [Zizania palustris]